METLTMDLWRMAKRMMDLAVFLFLIATANAGDTYDCIKSSGDYVNYAQRVTPHSREIIIARDSAVEDPRWRPMLDPNDLKRLIFTQAQNTTTLVIRNE